MLFPNLQEKVRAIGGNALIIDSYQPVRWGIFSTGYSVMARVVLVSGYWSLERCRYTLAVSSRKPWQSDLQKRLVMGSKSKRVYVCSTDAKFGHVYVATVTELQGLSAAPCGRGRLRHGRMDHMTAEKAGINLELNRRKLLRGRHWIRGIGSSFIQRHRERRSR